MKLRYLFLSTFCLGITGHAKSQEMEIAPIVITASGFEQLVKEAPASITVIEKKIFQVDDSIRWVGIRFPQFANELFDNVYGKNL